ncbi:MAG: GNAT family N-acetyltransferase, partial [Candidatus Cloacimonas sp.]|nr:GNAT family N-acetyltransferase [Candidatus Cloacimonas sp.]
MITFGLEQDFIFDQWAKLFRLLPRDSRSPFFSQEYYRAYNAVEEAEIECFWGYKDDENFLFYPYLKKSVNSLGYHLEEEYFDVSGAYGYNGPLGLAKDADFVELFNDSLQRHFTKNRVVSEFVRYCPITNNRSFHTYTQQFDVLDNVYISLAHGLDWVWNESFEYRVRKSVRKGESYGLSTSILRGAEISEGSLSTFFERYNCTMERNDAGGFYYFAYEFFDSMVKSMGEMVLLAITYLGEKAITAELVLVGGNIAFGFLGGTLSEFYNYKANTFQRWDLLKYLHALGGEKYSMGGGASRGDSI